MATTFKHLALIIIALLITGCATTKRKIEKSAHTQIDSVFVKRDSVKNITINRAIKDTVFLPISTGNKKIDSIVTERLQHFKTSKKSGTNSYGIRYDKKTKGFEITSQVGQTKNVLEQKKDSIINNKKERVVKEKEEIKIKYRVPFWLWIAFLVLAGVIYIATKFKLI